jgi:glycosyltransferase 2 family protein
LKAKLVSARPESFRVFTPKNLALLTAVLTLSISTPLLIGGQVTFQQLGSVSRASLTALLLLLVMKWALNTLRCQILFRANGIHLRSIDTLTMIWLYDAAAEGTPGGLGGPAVGWALMRRRQVPGAMITAIGLFIIVVDIIAIIGLLLWGPLLHSLLHGQGAPWQIAFALAAGLMTLGLAWMALIYRRRLIRHLGTLSRRLHISKQHNRVHARRWLRLGSVMEDMTQMSVLSLLMILLASIGYWCCRLSILFVAILAVGQHVAWPDTLLIQLTSGLAGMAVGLPGGFLGADMTVSALLLPVMDTKSIATVILLWRLLTFHASLLMGAMTLIVLRVPLLFPDSNTQRTD